MVAVEEPLHRQLGLQDDELERIRRDPRARAEPHRARDVRRHVVGALLVQVLEGASADAADRRVRRSWSGPGRTPARSTSGDGVAVVFKMESHSHPSAIEPYQGAATGVGGIVRDIISMGARPVALLDPLRFGPLTDARNRYLFEGVVAGIGGYGNCIGVPTVGGEIQFAAGAQREPRGERDVRRASRRPTGS